jgi:hypothetical protein
MVLVLNQEYLVFNKILIKYYIYTHNIFFYDIILVLTNDKHNKKKYFIYKKFFIR